MDWKDEELDEGERVMTYPVNPPKDSTHRRETVRAIMTRAVELAAARGGEKAPSEEEIVASVQNLSLNEGCKAWVAEARRARLEERRLGARNAVLEAEKANAHQFECEGVREGGELCKHCIGCFNLAMERLTASEEANRELVRRAQKAEGELAAYRRTVSTEATLSAAGQVHQGDIRCWCGAETDVPHAPCSTACTNDDAKTPGHPERVKERSEAVRVLSEKILLGPDVVDSGHGTRGPVRVVSDRARAQADAYAEGAEDMREACLIAVREALASVGAWDRETERIVTTAIEGAAP